MPFNQSFYLNIFHIFNSTAIFCSKIYLVHKNIRVGKSHMCYTSCLWGCPETPGELMKHVHNTSKALSSFSCLLSKGAAPYFAFLKKWGFTFTAWHLDTDRGAFKYHISRGWVDPKCWHCWCLKGKRLESLGLHYRKN